MRKILQTFNCKNGWSKNIWHYCQPLWGGRLSYIPFKYNHGAVEWRHGLKVYIPATWVRFNVGIFLHFILCSSVLFICDRLLKSFSLTGSLTDQKCLEFSELPLKIIDSLEARSYFSTGRNLRKFRKFYPVLTKVNNETDAQEKQQSKTTTHHGHWEEKQNIDRNNHSGF